MIEGYDGNVLLADEMGLGKTIQALAWTRMAKPYPVLVVCPANAKYVWEREGEKWLGHTPTVIEGNFKNNSRLEGDVIVINYDILSTWLPELRRYKFRCIIIDESQNIANISTKRYKAINNLVVREIKKGNRMVRRTPLIPHRIAISGTPLTNNPSELWGTLSIVWPQLFLSPWKFFWEYTRPFRLRGQWIFSGAKNLKKLHAELKSLGMIRRLKADVLKDLPEKERRIIYIRIAHEAEYRKAKNDFIHWLTAISPKRAKKARRAEALVKIGYLLRLTAKFKLRTVAEWIDSFLEDTDRKLIVFSYCAPILRVLEKRYGKMCVRIDGSVRGRDRMALVDRFQTDKRCRLAVCNGKAAGVALTLTAASDVLGADFPWAPGTLMQAEDRVHRFGQKNKVVITYLVGKDTIEEHVMKVLIQKQTVIEKVLNGKVSGDSKNLRTLNKSMAKILISHVLKS